MNHAVHRSIEPPPGTGRARKFNLNRAQVVDQNFIEFVRNWVAQGFSPGEHNRTGEFESPTSKEVGHPSRSSTEPITPLCELTGQDLIELFESQIIARHQDIASREMRALNEGFYTIASAGHEGNAVVGRITRHTDIAFVLYRSGAFMAERARKVPGVDFVKDRETKEPAKDLVHDLVQQSFRKGLLLLPCGESVIRLAPPLVVDEYDVDAGLRILDEVLTFLAE